MGRRTKLTKKVLKAIEQGLRAGNYCNTVLGYVGVSTSAYHNWINRGERELKRMEAEAQEIEDMQARGETVDPKRKRVRPRAGEGIYVELVEAVKSASAEGEYTAVLAVRAAWRTDWKAAMTYLERRYPDRWGRRDRSINLNANLSQKEVDKIFDQLEPEELNELERLLTVADQRRAASSVQGEEKS